MRYHEPAICLRASDYSETSQVVTFLTRGEGKVRLLAKGTKRPKSKSGGAIDLLAEGDLVYSLKDPNTLGTLMEFGENVSHRDVRTGSRRLNVALFALELACESLADGDPHPEVFDLLRNTLRRLGDEGAPLDAVLAYYQWRLLRHVGLLGGLDACIGCGTSVTELPLGETVYFSSRSGGLLCDGCKDHSPERVALQPGCLAALAALAAAERGKRVHLPEAHALAANRLLAYHASEQLGKRLKMAKHALRQ